MLTQKSEAWGLEVFMRMGIGNYFTSALKRLERLGVTWAYVVFQILNEKDLERLKDEGWETRLLVMCLPCKHKVLSSAVPPGKKTGAWLSASYPSTAEAGIRGSRWFARQPVSLNCEAPSSVRDPTHNISWGTVSEDHKNSIRLCVHMYVFTHLHTPTWTPHSLKRQMKEMT